MCPVENGPDQPDIGPLPPSRESGDPGSAQVRLVIFRAGEDCFGLHIQQLQVIFPLAKLAVLPGAPAHVRGVVNHRGSLVPIVDLARLIGTGTASAKVPMVMVVEVEEIGAAVGVLVDEVTDIVDVSTMGIEKAIPTLPAPLRPWVDGMVQVGDVPIALLQLRRLAAKE